MGTNVNKHSARAIVCSGLAGVLIAAASANAQQAEPAAPDVNQLKKQLEEERANLEALRRSLEEQETKLQGGRRELQEQQRRLEDIQRQLGGGAAPA